MHTSYIALHRWGVLDRLLEDNRFDVEALSGTSGGAVNAVASSPAGSTGVRWGLARRYVAPGSASETARV